ncbi:MAG: hypothetical protein ACRDZ3_08290, partial [Acidimicrobiia bacterium]
MTEGQPGRRGRPWREPELIAARRRRLGLRTRVTLAFAFGALLLSVAFSAVSYGLVRNYLVTQREDAAVEEALDNARLARDSLRTTDPNLPRILASLRTPSDSPAVVFYDENWFSSSPLDVGEDSLPPELRRDVARGVASRQAYRVARGGGPRLAVGVPLPLVDARYFEI